MRCDWVIANTSPLGRWFFFFFFFFFGFFSFSLFCQWRVMAGVFSFG